jgi:hypothetical protein
VESRLPVLGFVCRMSRVTNVRAFCLTGRGHRMGTSALGFREARTTPRQRVALEILRGCSADLGVIGAFEHNR